MTEAKSPTTPEDADMSLAAIEGHADAWAERINLNAMIENATSPMRLSRRVPDNVRDAFAKQMREQIDAIVRQAFIEGAVNALDGFAPVDESSDHE